MGGGLDNAEWLPNYNNGVKVLHLPHPPYQQRSVCMRRWAASRNTADTLTVFIMLEALEVHYQDRRYFPQIKLFRRGSRLVAGWAVPALVAVKCLFLAKCLHRYIN